MPILITPGSGFVGIAEEATVLTLVELLPHALSKTPSAAVSAPRTSVRPERCLMIDLLGGCRCSDAHAPPQRARENLRAWRAPGSPARAPLARARPPWRS